MAKSTKPAKPRPDFPLFPHSGRWAKKIRGKRYYFGSWDDPDAALNRYLDEKDDLYAGRKPRSKREGLTVEDGCNLFLHHKRQKVDSGELAELTWKDYRRTCRTLVKVFGGSRRVEDLDGTDFQKLRAAFATVNKRLVGLKNQVIRTRCVFKYLAKAKHISKPVDYGADFDAPDPKRMRRERSQSPKKMFEPAEIRAMIDTAPQPMRTMILLGVNCGFGNTDVGRLPLSAVDLRNGWVTFPRPKTGSERRCPLWPETIDALRDAIQRRPKPADEKYSDLVFLTARGKPWDKESTTYLAGKFREFKEGLKLNRPRCGFYALRHVFETIGGESCDQVAVDSIMGHERGEMGAHYRERISDERLLNVVNTVREWLYAEPAGDDEDEPAIVRFRTVG